MRKSPRRRIAGWNETSDAAKALKEHGPLDRTAMCIRAGIDPKNGTRCCIELYARGFLATTDFNIFDLTSTGHAFAGQYIPNMSEEDFAVWNEKFTAAAKYARDGGTAQQRLFA